ncbi:MAG: hypothetical protein ACOY82_20435 [Pseudomonadota bacterium]
MDERSYEQTTEAESERLRRASDDVLMRMGRNLLVYQRIERNLKQLAANRRPLTLGPRIRPDDVRSQIDANRAKTERHTLGQLLPLAFMDADNSEASDSEDLGPIRMTISSRTTFDDDRQFFEWRKGWQEALVATRNRLAHAFLDNVDIETIEGCERAGSELDAAYDTALRLLHWLRSCLDGQTEAMLLGLEHVRSEEFWSSLHLPLSLSALVVALGTTTERLARPDGWCVFDRAAQAVRAEQGDLIAEVLGLGNFRTLQHAAEATDAFAWREEPTRNGTRWLFRWQSTESHLG